MNVETKPTEETTTKDTEPTESPTAVADDTATSFKAMLGIAKKKPRAEYQAEIDELKEEQRRLCAELRALKKWIAEAPIKL